MSVRPLLCLLPLLAGQVSATPEGLRVRQYPPSLSVMRGDTATLSCHFKAESLKYGVQWFRMKSEKQLILKSPRHIAVERNQTSTLVISQVTLEDCGWYYCEVNVLQNDPEWGNGTELIVLVPPSAPRLYLQIPSDPQSGEWALLCFTGGFHPSVLSLTWAYQSTAADTELLSVTNCTLHADSSTTSASEHSAGRLVSSAPSEHSKCFQMTDRNGQEMYLFSVFLLPKKQFLQTGIVFTCGVQDHPAMTGALTASFTWDAPPNELIAYLNIVKMCFLSAVTAMLLLEAVKHFWVQGK